MNEDVHESDQDFSKECGAELWKALNSTSFIENEEGIGWLVGDIIEHSIKVDEQFCRQVAYMKWTWPMMGSEFDSATMEMDSLGQVSADGGKRILLTLAPGLSKFGRSTGDGFGTEQVLLKPKVAWLSLPS